MASLRQGKWSVISARQLHAQVQLKYLWKFHIPELLGLYNQDMEFLAQSCKIPGVRYEQKEYSIGGITHYYLGKSYHGGPVTARFVEVDDGKVDLFFRKWDLLTDAPAPSLASLVRARLPRVRRPVGLGDGISGYSRTARVQMYTREGEVNYEYLLFNLKLVSFGPFELAYGDSGPLMVDVNMVCDEVVRSG